MRSSSFCTSFRLIGALLVSSLLFLPLAVGDVADGVGDAVPDDAFFDNNDWKKLASTSFWDGPPPPGPLAAPADTGLVGLVARSANEDEL
jgi:hypothetical protein